MSLDRLAKLSNNLDEIITRTEFFDDCFKKQHENIKRQIDNKETPVFIMTDFEAVEKRFVDFLNAEPVNSVEDDYETITTLIEPKTESKGEGLVEENFPVRRYFYPEKSGAVTRNTFCIASVGIKEEIRNIILPNASVCVLVGAINRWQSKAFQNLFIDLIQGEVPVILLIKLDDMAEEKHRNDLVQWFNENTAGKKANLLLLNDFSDASFIDLMQNIDDKKSMKKMEQYVKNRLESLIIELEEKTRQKKEVLEKNWSKTSDEYENKLTRLDDEWRKHKSKINELSTINIEEQRRIKEEISKYISDELPDYLYQKMKEVGKQKKFNRQVSDLLQEKLKTKMIEELKKTDERLAEFCEERLSEIRKDLASVMEGATKMSVVDSAEFSRLMGIAVGGGYAAAGFASANAWNFFQWSLAQVGAGMSSTAASFVYRALGTTGVGAIIAVGGILASMGWRKLTWKGKTLKAIKKQLEQQRLKVVDALSEEIDSHCNNARKLLEKGLSVAKQHVKSRREMIQEAKAGSRIDIKEKREETNYIYNSLIDLKEEILVLEP